MWFFHFHQSFFSSVETLKRSKVCSAANGDSVSLMGTDATIWWPAHFLLLHHCHVLHSLIWRGGGYVCFCIYSPSFTFNLLLWWLVRLYLICTNKDNDLPKNDSNSYPPLSSLPSPVFPGSWSNFYRIQFHKWKWPKYSDPGSVWAFTLQGGRCPATWIRLFPHPDLIFHNCEQEKKSQQLWFESLSHADQESVTEPTVSATFSSVQKL